ncbi:MAG: MerR family transcriptional regulator [Bacteroidetes bacterium]|nr:MerR family transcriptional regulator [Bacteroidota bacterium]
MIEIPPDEILFKKQYYSIGEVSSMFHLNASLLRYWETEFDIIKPRKNRKGDRHFRPEDIKNLQLIHHLLRQRKYTIEGAKEYLKKNKSKAQQNFELIQRLEKLKSFLLQLKAGL